MKPVPGAGFLRGSRKPRALAEVSELAALLVAISGGTDGGNGGSRLLLDELISIARRPSPTARNGLAELRLLRQFPGDQKAAQAAAGIIVDRAHADTGFSAALDAWRRKERVREYLGSPAGETGSMQASENKRKKSIGRRFWPWAAGIATAVVIALATHLVNSIPSDVGNLFSSSGHVPVKIETVTPLEDASGDTQALANRIQLSAHQLTQLSQVTSDQSGLPMSLHTVPTQIASTDVTVMGNDKSTVTITSIQVLKKCQAPLTGALFFNSAQGSDHTIGLGFNLDHTISNAQNAQPDQPFSGNYFQGHVITLKYGETQTFEISASTFLHYCQFTFQMTVSTSNGPVTEYFGAAGQETSSAVGQPFKLTAIANSGPLARTLPFSSYRTVYVGGAYSEHGEWAQVNPKTYKYGTVN
jgi:hypothetical protein